MKYSRSTPAYEGLHEEEAPVKEAFALLFEGNPQPMWIRDLATGRLLAVNPAASRVYGICREDSHTARPELDSSDGESRLAEFVETANVWLDGIQAGEEMGLEVRTQAVDWHGTAAELVVAGELPYSPQAAEHWRNFFSLSHDLLAVSDREGNLLWLSAAWERTFGYTIEEILGCNLAEFAHPDDAPDALHMSQTLAEGTSLPAYVVRGRCRDDRYRTLECHAHSRGDYIYTLAKDITEQREAEIRLRDLSRAVEQSPVSVVITDTCGNIEYVNPKFEQLTGYRAEEVMGKNSRILKSGTTSRHQYRQLWETILAGRVWEGEFQNRKKDGTTYLERATISPVRDENGKIRHFVAVKEDITEKRALEKQLLQAQKMEAVGMLAGGIAHDFNNLLTIINGYSDLLNNLEDATEEQRSYARNIAEAGEKAAQLTQKLLVFSRQQIVEQKCIDLNKIVTELAKFYRRVLPGNIQLELQCEADSAPIIADPTQMEQVLMNLVVNARDAMPLGGRLTIGVATVEVKAPPAEGCLPPGRYVRLQVADDGEGMTEQVQSHIFEPFFSTKPVGRGTGLGLPTVHGIVKQSGGSIQVKSAPGAGTTFTIHFPESPDPVTADSSAPDTDSHPKGEETILLVEDFADLRNLTAKLLAGLGYRVIQAASGEEAISIVCKERGAIDLVLSDVMLPGLTGPDAAKQIRAAFWHIGALLMTGHAGQDVLSGPDAIPGMPILKKPFNAQTLRNGIREALRQARQSFRILVADDDPAIREFLHSVLSTAGYRADTAANGDELLHRARETAPDVMLVDLVMPGKEGIETIMELRRRGLHNRVVAMSGAFNGQFLEAAKVIGSRATLLKPISVPLLLTTIREVLRHGPGSAESPHGFNSLNVRNLAESVGLREKP